MMWPQLSASKASIDPQSIGGHMFPPPEVAQWQNRFQAQASRRICSRLVHTHTHTHKDVRQQHARCSWAAGYFVVASTIKGPAKSYPSPVSKSRCRGQMWADRSSWVTTPTQIEVSPLHGFCKRVFFFIWQKTKSDIFFQTLKSYQYHKQMCFFTKPFLRNSWTSIIKGAFIRSAIRGPINIQ